jgi:hypothetical protein
MKIFYILTYNQTIFLVNKQPEILFSSPNHPPFNVMLKKMELLVYLK